MNRTPRRLSKRPARRHAPHSSKRTSRSAPKGRPKRNDDGEFMYWSGNDEGGYGGERRSARFGSADYYDVDRAPHGWTVRISYSNDPHPGRDGYYGERFQAGTGRRLFVVLSDGTIGRDNDANRRRVGYFTSAAAAKAFASNHARGRMVHPGPPPETREPDPGFGDWFSAWWDAVWA